MNLFIEKNMKIILVIGAIFLLGACSSSPDPNLYLLRAINGSISGTPNKEMTVQIGEVSIPDHLRDHRIITYGQGSQVSASEFNRWAEPLDKNISAVLAKNLAQSLGTDKIINQDSGLVEDPDFTVNVDVTEFSIELGIKVRLEAIWGLSYATGETFLLQSFKSQRTSPGGTYDGAVGDLNFLIGALSEDIAKAILEAK